MIYRRLICYLLGHRWNQLPYEDGPKEPWVYERHECLRCEASRRELVAGRLG